MLPWTKSNWTSVFPGPYSFILTIKQSSPISEWTTRTNISQFRGNPGEIIFWVPQYGPEQNQHMMGFNLCPTWCEFKQQFQRAPLHQAISNPLEDPRRQTCFCCFSLCQRILLLLDPSGHRWLVSFASLILILQKGRFKGWTIEDLYSDFATMKGMPWCRRNFGRTDVCCVKIKGLTICLTY